MARAKSTAAKTKKPTRIKAAPHGKFSPPSADGRSFADTSRAEYVYQQMRSAIQDGRYRQGERIREQEIAISLGVSRTPVREALRRLQTRGLLEIVSGRGLGVVEFTKPQVLELYAMRELLEGAAARLAAQHATPAEILQLREMQVEFSQPGNSSQRLAQINKVFHRAICDAAHNRYMVQSLNDLGDALALLHDTTFSVPGRAKEAIAEHNGIVNAIEARDADTAEKTAREHIRRARQTRMQMLYAV